MREENDSQGEPHTLTVEQQNNLMLKEILKISRRLQRIHLVSFITTVSFIVLPIIGTAIFLPRIIRTYTSIFSQYTQDSGIAPTGNLQELFNQVQELQKKQ